MPDLKIEATNTRYNLLHITEDGVSIGYKIFHFIDTVTYETKMDALEKISEMAGIKAE